MLVILAEQGEQGNAIDNGYDAVTFSPTEIPYRPSVTNTQGKPLHRFSILPSLGVALHVPTRS